MKLATNRSSYHVTPHREDVDGELTRQAHLEALVERLGAYARIAYKDLIDRPGQARVDELLREINHELRDRRNWLWSLRGASETLSNRGLAQSTLRALEERRDYIDRLIEAERQRQRLPNRVAEERTNHDPANSKR